MTPFETQNAQIKQLLLEGKSITPTEAMKRFNCNCLSSRVSDLRSSGMPIKREKIRNGRSIVKRYSIPEEYLAIANNAAQPKQTTNQQSLPKKSASKPKSKEVYVVTCKTYNRNSPTGNIYLWDTEVVGVFAEEAIARDFTKQLTNGIEFANNRRNFDCTDVAGEKRNFVFGFVQRQNLYPMFVYNCFRETVLQS